MSLLLSVVGVFRRGAKIGLAVGMSLASVGPAFSRDTLVITVDQAKVMKTPAGVRTLVIGNPMIADVTLLKEGGTMIVTGKGFGETNLIALDAAGNLLAESMIEVVAGGNALIVQRGMDRESYTCAPRCQPTARLGDDPKFFNDVAGQMQARDRQATAR